MPKKSAGDVPGEVDAILSSMNWDERLEEARLKRQAVLAARKVKARAPAQPSPMPPAEIIPLLPPETAPEPPTNAPAAQDDPAPRRPGLAIALGGWFVAAALAAYLLWPQDGSVARFAPVPDPATALAATEAPAQAATPARLALSLRPRPDTRAIFPSRPVLRGGAAPGSAPLVPAMALAPVAVLSEAPAFASPAPRTLGRLPASDTDLARPVPASLGAPDLSPPKPTVAPSRIVTALVYAPSTVPEAEVSAAVARIAGMGFAAELNAIVPFGIGDDQIRYFHDRDRPEAERLAAQTGFTPRDFTSFTPPPAEGTLEVWLSGRAAQRIAAPAPSAPPEPQAIQSAIGAILSGLAGPARTQTPLRQRRDDDGDGGTRIVQSSGGGSGSDSGSGGGTSGGGGGSSGGGGNSGGGNSGNGKGGGKK